MIAAKFVSIWELGFTEILGMWFLIFRFVDLDNSLVLPLLDFLVLERHLLIFGFWRCGAFGLSWSDLRRARNSCFIPAGLIVYVVFEFCQSA